MTSTPPLRGLGLGWRPELANLALRRSDLTFVEVVAEALPSALGRRAPIPLPLARLAERGVAIVPHGISLGLGGADRPDRHRLAHLAGLAEAFGAPLVSEHVACVRAGGREVGHLLPLRRSRAQLDVLVENVREAQDRLPVALALEPVASVVDWPAARHEIPEGAFLAELVERTDAWLLLDVANVLVNCANHGGDPSALLDAIPLERVAYVHAAGGVEQGGVRHDTHLHPLWPEIDELLADLAARGCPSGVMLERDGRYPPDDELSAELDRLALASTVARG